MVNIGLEDRNLLKWFNQIHAALMEAQAEKNRVIKISRGEIIKSREKKSMGLVVNGLFISGPLAIQFEREGNTRLIASLEAVVKEVQQSSVLRKIGK